MQPFLPYGGMCILDNSQNENCWVTRWETGIYYYIRDYLLDHGGTNESGTST